MPALIVRPFLPADVPALLGLMKGLARFEGYIDEFAVTEADLIDSGLCDAPKFEAFVAAQQGGLIGMAVIYNLPWTYDLKPKLVLKELFVTENARGIGAGRALMRAVVLRASELGATSVNWTVLKGNRRAEAFYRSLGGAPDPIWDGWAMDRDAIASQVRGVG